jgi:hypothetical protein
MNKKEVIAGLKSTRNEKVEKLEALQVQGAEAIKALDEARKAEDAGLVSEASEKFERIGEEIKAAQEAIEGTQEQLGWFKEYKDEEEVTYDKESRMEELKSLFAELKSVSSVGGATPLTIGTHFGNILKHRGIRRVEDIKDLRAMTQLTALLGQTPDAREIVKGLSEVKSIYTNHGAEVLDASEDPVPGFMGFQCGLVEDTNVTCLLEPPADDFEECITQATLAGNRIRFTREASRDNNAASVLETVYNPYPTLEVDGTKPEGIFTLETLTVNDSKIAQFVTASDEVLEDCPSVAGLIDNFLISGINQEKRRQLINGSGVNGQMRGILNQSGLLARTHQDVGDGGTADDNYYDTFRRGLTDLWLQSARTDNVCVILNPRDGEIIDLTKDELGHYLFNDADCFNRMLRCMKIRYSVDVPQGTAVMGEFGNNWVFYTRKALTIKMGYTGDQFITNTNTILGEMRGLTLVRCPRKILKVTGLA